MFILSFIFVIVCGLLNGRESVQVFYRLFIYMYYRWKPVALYQEGSFGIPLTGFVSPRHIFVPIPRQDLVSPRHIFVPIPRQDLVSPRHIFVPIPRQDLVSPRNIFVPIPRQDLVSPRHMLWSYLCKFS
jgi:hypothetical protein